MSYFEWIFIVLVFAAIAGLGFFAGLIYARKFMQDLIAENVTLNQRICDCQAQLRWARGVDTVHKGEYNRRLTDKLLEEHTGD